MSVGSYVIWNDLCQSVDSGEEDEGWPSYEAALSACSEGSDMPAFHGPRGLVFGPAACAKAEAALLRADAQDAADSARRAAVVASIAAQAPAVVAAKPDRAMTLAKMLASNEASLAACKKTDRAEIARLRDNCARLRADLGIKTPDEKLLSAIFG
jgi:hypothetical protein